MRYVAGIDGGGTKTAVAIADMDGNIVHRFTAGPLNYNGQDEDSFHAVLKDICDGIADICGGLEACLRLCVGAAGISNPVVGGRLETGLRASGYPGAIMLAGDHEIALAGAHERLSGIIVIAGTGSICFGRNAEGSVHRAGGFGHLIDDEGSGYSIGRDLLSAVVRAADGREEPTVISSLVNGRLGAGSVQDIVGYVYDKSRSKKDIAALSDLLSEACEAGDAVALRIADKNAAALVELAAAVTERLGMQEDELAMAGSVLLRNRHIRESFLRSMQERYPRLRCGEGKQDAAYGAVLLALQEERGAGSAAAEEVKP